jgi:hypothetical protein
MLELYHFDNSVYSQKARLALEEKLALTPYVDRRRELAGGRKAAGGGLTRDAHRFTRIGDASD